MRLFNAALAVFALLVAGPAALAADRNGGTLLTLTASGHSEAPPDMAVISLGVVTRGPTAAQATTENARRMTALTEALQQIGIAERDVQTIGISVGPEYVYQQGVAPRLTGYQTTNNVMVRVRRLEILGAVIDAAIGAGGNTVYSVGFAHQDPSHELQEARRNAAIDARARADAYASGFGLHVVRVVSATEEGARAYSDEEVVVTGTIFRNNGGSPAPPTTPVAPGELSTSVQINVTFELR